MSGLSLVSNEIIKKGENIIQFSVVVNKKRFSSAGPLLDHIQKKKVFTERQASLVLKDIATAVKFLHDKGIS